MRKETKYGWQYWVGAIITIAVIIIFSQGYFQKFLESSKLSWVDVKSEEGNFFISFPQKPEVKREIIRSDFGNVEMVTYFVNAAFGLGYSFAYFDRPPEAEVAENRTTEQIFDDSVTSNVNGVGGTLITHTVISLNEYPGRYYRYQVGENLVDARIFLVKNRFYILHVGAPREKITYKNGDEFFNSFKLLTK